MSGESGGDRDDGKWRWNQEDPMAASAQCHLSNWKVVLLLYVCVLVLAEGRMLTEEREDSRSITQKEADRMVQKQQYRSRWHSRAPWAVFNDLSLAEEGESFSSRWERSPPDSIATVSSRRKFRKDRKNRKRGREGQDCRLEKKQMRVRDLGLGYDSDEIVLFKYCVGSCSSARKNYDVALKVLTENGSISGRKVSIQPCCRPTRFETVSFMDAHTSWQTIRWLSAANCSCVG